MSQRANVIRTAAAAFLAAIGVVSALAARDVLAWRAKYDLEGLPYLYKPLSNGEPPPLLSRQSNNGPNSGGGGSPGSSAGAGF